MDQHCRLIVVDKGGRAFNWEGGGRFSPLASPPPSPKKGSIDGAPKNPTETDPRAPEVTQTRNSAKKKMKRVFLESARRGGSERSSFAMYLVKQKIEHFQCSKRFSAPSAPELIITN